MLIPTSQCLLLNWASTLKAHRSIGGKDHVVSGLKFVTLKHDSGMHVCMEKGPQGSYIHEQYNWTRLHIVLSTCSI